MPPKPREGAEEALEITFVVKPENVGAVEDAPIPNPNRFKIIVIIILPVV
jgi:hypothetical protein